MSFDRKDMDDFWDISKLIPKKKPTLTPFATKAQVADVVISGYTEEPKKPSGDARTKLTLDRSAETKESYEYSDGLVKRVSITRFVDKFDFYGNFRKAAIVYYDFKTPKCDFVQFYSYLPQYSQFNSAQKNFYFYWRDSVRRGKYIKTDYSYFYLYVYEILNLPDKIPANEALSLLCRLWSAYRKELPNIDKNMALWIQDFCLVYKLPCPTDLIADFIFDAISASDFKEFYLANADITGEDGTGAIIAYLSDYDWRSGKYAGGDNREAYRKHLLGAMGLLIRRLWKRGEILSGSGAVTKISRNAFQNSLCTHSVKCRLEIEYIPLSSASELRKSFTAAVRYTENKLRALISVKSRLAIKDLPDEYKLIIDSYFEDVFAKVNRERAKANEPEYERQYDSVREALSFEGADEIERLSWTTTARLVENSEEESVFPSFNLEEESTEPVALTENQEDNTPSADTYGLTSLEISFLSAILSEDNEKMSKIAREEGSLPDAIVEKINEAFADGFGDVIIEGDAPDYRIIEDYSEEVKEWLLKITK